MGENDGMGAGYLGKFNKPYLSHKEAASYLGLKESSLYGLVSKGKIIPFKAGGLNKYRARDLDRFLEECGQEAAQKRKRKPDTEGGPGSQGEGLH